MSRRLERALQRLPASKRAQLARTSVARLLKASGFRGPVLTVTPAGDVVRATVNAADACSSTSGTANRIATQVRRFLPSVHEVAIIVGPGGEPLSRYIARHCSGQRLPGGRGRVVLTQQGSSLATTRSFTIHSRRWTVEYVNAGTFLQVFPTRGSVPTTDAFTVSRRGPGRKVLTHAGTFKLRVGGSGDWIIRVRDGA